MSTEKRDIEVNGFFYVIAFCSFTQLVFIMVALFRIAHALEILAGVK